MYKKSMIFIFCILLSIFCMMYLFPSVGECRVNNNDNKIVEYSNPLSEKDIEYILSFPKGSRPEPETYLDSKYIKNHLKLFSNGISLIVGLDTYYKYIAFNIFVGREDNTCFVMPKYVCDAIEVLSDGDLSVWEKMLSFDDGYFTNQGGIVRLDINYIKNLNIRMSNGNELGANEYWIPGGYTIGGIPEAVTNKIPVNRVKVTIYNKKKNSNRVANIGYPE